MSTTALFAVQHIRKLTGKTQAHLMRASDGHLYVTKFSNNPLGIRALVSEFLATKIELLYSSTSSDKWHVSRNLCRHNYSLAR